MKNVKDQQPYEIAAYEAQVYYYFFSFFSSI